jgi:pyridoxine kinase
MRGVQDAVLSIQSHVSFGHVGNSAAVLPLQRLGLDVFPVHTVQLAHHPGYGAWRGHQVEPERIGDILSGLREIGALRRCAALLSGYLGQAAVGEPLLRALQALRRERADALYLCDPVIGDDDAGIFVAAGVPELLRDHLVPAADIITPNRFELAWLAERDVQDLDAALAAATTLRDRGPDLVIATGLPLGAGELGVLAASADGAWLVRTPHHPNVPHGTGDVMSALFLGHYLKGRDLPQALERSVSAMYALIERTLELGGEELRLVESQDVFADLGRRFPARALALGTSSA